MKDLSFRVLRLIVHAFWFEASRDKGRRVSGFRILSGFWEQP